jgi:PEP-CTERM/exosortase A-associated glycosyltransferase
MQSIETKYSICDRSVSAPDIREPSSLPLRIMHILDHSHPVLTGYSVRSHSLIKAQNELGFASEALTGPLHQIDDQSASEIVIDGVRYRRTVVPGKFMQRIFEWRIPFAREQAVVRLLRDRIIELLGEGQFDALHAHSPALCGLAALEATKAHKIPFVYEIRAFWEDAAVDQNKARPTSVRYLLSRWLERYVTQHADAVVGISRHILDDLRKRGVDDQKLFHIPNGVDAERFTPQPRDRLLAAELGLKEEPVMGFIGSLYRYEGIAWLVTAAAELKRRGVPLQLLIVGQGEQMPDILAAVEQEQAQEYVHVLGQVPHRDVSRYYSMVDVFVYPRRRVRLTELTTPLKPLEAMAQGKPVLASDVGGIRELVEPEKPCLLFEPDDVEDFCRKASQLLCDDNLRRKLAESGREMVLRCKDWKVLAHRYEAVYAFAKNGSRNSQ